MVRTASRPGTHYRMVEGLQKRLASGEKALIANSAYRRYLRRTGAGKAFEVDAGKRAEEARFDGIFVLRANARMTPLNAVLRYRELLMVEDLFRRAKAQLRTPPDLPLLRRRDPRPRLLLLPCLGAPEGTGRPLPHRRRHRRMGRPDPRPRPPARGRHREGRQAHHHPHPHRRPGRQGLPGRRRRAPAELARKQ